jgi:hypothetical protein
MDCSELDRGELAERYLTGQLDSSAQDEFEVHILECAKCLRAVEILQSVSDDLAQRAHEIRTDTSTGRLWLRWKWVAAGAFSVLLCAAGILQFQFRASSKSGNDNNASVPSTIASQESSRGTLPPASLRVPTKPTTLPSGKAPATPSASTKPANVEIRGWSPGSKVFVDASQVGSIDRSGIIATSVIPEPHEIRVIDKNGEAGTMHRTFAAGEIAELSKKDFVLGRPSIPLGTPTPNPPPAINAEERDWQKIKDSASIAELEKFRDRYPKSHYQEDLQEKLDNLYWEKVKGAGTVASFDEYLGKFPNGRYRVEAQENLAWNKAEAGNTVPAFRDYQRQNPQGAHFDSAGRAIEVLRFEAARNSEDEAVSQSFLKDYPSGEFHDQISGRLDDLVWERTRKDDLTSLRAYLQKFERGRHADQAQEHIEQLIEATTLPPPTRPRGDDKQAVRDVLTQYRHAYENKNVEELKRMWPGMTSSVESGLRKVFKDSRIITMTCEVVDEPEITGDQAMIRFTQSLSIDGRQQTTEVVMTLRRVASNAAAKSWEINSVGK